MSQLIHRYNLKEEISSIRDGIIFQSRTTRHLRDHNFPIFTEYNYYLYHIFIEKCKNLFDFTLRDRDFSIWCLENDKNFTGGHNKWHNHIKSSTINGVIYLKTVKGCGFKYCENYIDEQFDYCPDIIENVHEMFEEGRKINYIEPEDFDLLIFPNYMMHTSVFSGNETRVSLNLELRCHEKSIDIFNKKIPF